MPSPTVMTRKHSAKHEISSADIAVEQPPDIELPVDRPLEHTPDLIKPIDSATLASLSREYVKSLAFMAEPVTIVIHPPTDAHGSPVTDLVCVEGRWAEVLVGTRWVPWGYLPKGVDITVKRSTVEVLARAKRESVTTSIEWRNEDPKNIIRRFLSVRDPFSVIRDENPLGGAWITALFSGRA